MAEDSDTVVLERTPAQRRIAELVEQAGIAVVRMSVSDQDAKAIKGVRRWEEDSETAPAIGWVTGRR